MAKKLLYLWSVFFWILIIIPIAYSSSIEVSGAISELNERIQDFVGNTTPVIVVGSHINLFEKAILIKLNEDYPELKNITLLSDSDNINETGKTIILIGGKNQNRITKRVFRMPHDENRIELSFGILSFITSENGRYIVFSDKPGFYNNLSRNVEKSPLVRYIPERYVPVAASFIGVFILWLVKVIGMIGIKVGKLKISNKVVSRIKKKNIEEGRLLFGIRFKLREWVSIFTAAIVFALANAYSFFSHEVNALVIVLINVGSNMIIYIIRNLIRLVLDAKHKIHTQYFTWYFGAFLTILTGWLGNTFSMAGYIVSEKKTDNGSIPFIVNVVTFIAFIFLFLLNYIKPSLMLQMSSGLALSISYIQMLPLKPFSGKRIYRWKKPVWWVTFVIMSFAYFAWLL